MSNLHPKLYAQHLTYDKYSLNIVIETVFQHYYLSTYHNFVGKIEGTFLVLCAKNNITTTIQI